MNKEISEDTSWFDLVMSQDDIFDRIVEWNVQAASFQRVLMNEGIAERLTIRDIEAMLGIGDGGICRLAQGEDIEEFSSLDTPDDDPVLASGFPVHRSVDARAILDDGHEPLPAILDAADDLTFGSVLNVVAPFHPTPLRRLLRGRGFTSAAWPEEDFWRIVFMKRDALQPIVRRL